MLGAKVERAELVADLDTGCSPVAGKAHWLPAFGAIAEFVMRRAKVAAFLIE